MITIVGQGRARAATTLHLSGWGRHGGKSKIEEKWSFLDRWRAFTEEGDLGRTYAAWDERLKGLEGRG